MSKLLILTNECENIVFDLLTILENEKCVDTDLFEKLYSNLKEIEEMIRNKNTIPLKLAGILFLLYSSLCEHSNDLDEYQDPVFNATAIIEEYLSCIFGE